MKCSSFSTLSQVVQSLFFTRNFYTYNSGFPCAFICLSFMLMAVDFSRTQKGYSVHVFNLYYIVIDLEAGQYFVGRFQNFDYMLY